MTERPEKPERRRRWYRAHLDDARDAARAPRTFFRAALIRLWKVRGGGYYGLGYVTTFPADEAQTPETPPHREPNADEREG